MRDLRELKPPRLLCLIASGVLPVDLIRSHTCLLDEAGAVIEHCAKPTPPFEQVVVCP